MDTLSPSAAWDGSAGSGFVALPIDPVRTTAKPVARLISVPNQYFTHELTIGIYAGANNGGSLLDNFGLEKVVVHCEGSTHDIVAPSFHTFADANGGPVTYLGWWVTLERPLGTSGHAQVYFEAVPKDPAMQRRVIGPYQFSPQESLHDAELVVARNGPVVPGVSYNDIGDALEYCRDTGRQNALITVAEAGIYDRLYSGSNAGYEPEGFFTITATAPIVIRKPSMVASDSSMRMTTGGLDAVCFRGANITLDFSQMSSLQHAGSDRHFWMDGCTITDSTENLGLWRGKNRPYGWVVDGEPWFTECTLSHTQNVGRGTQLMRGCSLHDNTHDIAADTLCMVSNRVEGHDNDLLINGPDAVVVSYGGAEGSATISRIGNTFTAAWGASTASFTLDNSEAGHMAGTHYWPSNVVDWINTQLAAMDAGWSATLLDDTRYARRLCLPGTEGADFGPQDVLAGPLTLSVGWDIHADFYQMRNGGPAENIVMADNIGWNTNCQNLLLLAGGSDIQDWLVINNAISSKNPESNLSSQLSKPQSHVVFAHNSFDSQRLFLRDAWEPDDYCLVANNVLREISFEAGTIPANADAIVVNNLIHGDSADPDAGTGAIKAGDETSLFGLSNAGDFSPSGALLTELKTPVLRFDLAGALRAEADAVGSFSISPT